MQLTAIGTKAPNGMGLSNSQVAEIVAHAALARSGLGQAAYLACLADKIVERDN